MVPTEAGRRFLPEARAALAAADRAVAAVEAHRRATAGVLRLGFMTTATGTHTRRVLETWSAEMPGGVGAARAAELARPGRGSPRRRRRRVAGVRPPVADLEGLRLDVVRYEPRVVALRATTASPADVAAELADLDDEPHVTDDETDGISALVGLLDPRPSGRPGAVRADVDTLDELLEVVAVRTGRRHHRRFRRRQLPAPRGGLRPDHRRRAVPDLGTPATHRSPPIEALRRAVANEAARPDPVLDTTVPRPGGEQENRSGQTRPGPLVRLAQHQVEVRAQGGQGLVGRDVLPEDVQR